MLPPISLAKEIQTLLDIYHIIVFYFWDRKDHIVWRLRVFINYFNTYIINTMIRAGFDKAGLGIGYAVIYSLD